VSTPTAPAARPEALKALIAPYRAAAANFEAGPVRAAVEALLAPEATVRLGHPFGTGEGPAALLAALGELHAALPDLERRDLVLLAGRSPDGADWVAALGNYMGTSIGPLRGIPPTGRLVHLRYHEHFRVEDGRVVEIQALWDLPELMMQAGAWPMAPQLGTFLCTPGPMSGDGLHATGDGAASMALVQAMLAAMVRHPAEGGPELMQLERFWHPRMNWYGPAGIGTARGIQGFRLWHQIPFLRAMPDRGLDPEGLKSHWIAQGAYACETGWPNMRLTIEGHGWLGIAPAGQRITLRSLDFWRVEDGLIRENWVLVDLLDMYAQIGVDVLDRMAELTLGRSREPVRLPRGLPA
jgi:predicted ester cyclase